MFEHLTNVVSEALRKRHERLAVQTALDLQKAMIDLQTTQKAMGGLAPTAKCWQSSTVFVGNGGGVSGGGGGGSATTAAPLRPQKVSWCSHESLLCEFFGAVLVFNVNGKLKFCTFQDHFVGLYTYYVRVMSAQTKEIIAVYPREQVLGVYPDIKEAIKIWAVSTQELKDDGSDNRVPAEGPVEAANV